MDAQAYSLVYRRLLQYKAIGSNPPEGIFLAPSSSKTCLHEWDGVLFVKRGPFEGAVLRFILDLKTFHIKITTDGVVHPFVSIEGDVLTNIDNPPSQSIDEETQSILTVLNRYQQIFNDMESTLHDLPDHERCRLNRVAYELWQNNRTVFNQQAADCVRRSLQSIATQSGSAHSNSFVKFSPWSDKLHKLHTEITQVQL